MSLGNQVSSVQFVPASSVQTLATEASGDLFSDSSCGQALVSQRILLDFSPDEDLDPEFIKRKCIAFWEFVGRNPDLQSIATIPDYNVFDKSSPTPSSVPKEGSAVVDGETKTARSMLELVEHKGMIDRAFEGKLPHSYCSLGVAQYSENDSIAITQEKGPGGDGKRTNRKYQQSLKKLCVKLREWDMQHPKCTKPPGHSQTLLACRRRKDAS